MPAATAAIAHRDAVGGNLFHSIAQLEPVATDSSILVTKALFCFKFKRTQMSHRNNPIVKEALGPAKRKSSSQNQTEQVQPVFVSTPQTSSADSSEMEQGIRVAASVEAVEEEEGVVVEVHPVKKSNQVTS
jgi:hypothetical protein